jgi:isopropylmalate/homocitrate/citramalate synthase
MTLRQKDSYTREQKKEMMKELKKKNHDEFMAGLTDAQKKQLEEMKKNRKNRRMTAK